MKTEVHLEERDFNTNKKDKEETLLRDIAMKDQESKNKIIDKS